MINDKITINFKGSALSIHNSWSHFFKQTKCEIKEIEKYIGDDTSPSINKIFRVFETDLSSIKCVILGQDPYPNAEDATGRAFEVGEYVSWSEPTDNTSLRNILKLLYKAKTGDAKSIGHIRKEIEKNNFNILKPHELFNHWEKEGVLLLNTALTCKAGCPNSHSIIWSCFTKKLIMYLDRKNESLSWFLWGSHAQLYSCLILYGRKYMSSHPCKCGGDFLDKTIFFSGITGIDWYGESKDNSQF